MHWLKVAKLGQNLAHLLCVNDFFVAEFEAFNDLLELFVEFDSKVSVSVGHTVTLMFICVVEDLNLLKSLLTDTLSAQVVLVEALCHVVTAIAFFTQDLLCFLINLGCKSEIIAPCGLSERRDTSVFFIKLAKHSLVSLLHLKVDLLPVPSFSPKIITLLDFLALELIRSIFSFVFHLCYWVELIGVELAELTLFLTLTTLERLLRDQVRFERALFELSLLPVFLPFQRPHLLNLLLLQGPLVKRCPLTAISKVLYSNARCPLIIRILQDLVLREIKIFFRAVFIILVEVLLGLGRILRVGERHLAHVVAVAQALLHEVLEFRLVMVSAVTKSALSVLADEVAAGFTTGVGTGA